MTTRPTTLPVGEDPDAADRRPPGAADQVADPRIASDSHFGEAAHNPGDALAEMLARFLQAVRETPDRWYCIVMPVPGMPPEFHNAREQARSVALARATDVATGLLRTLQAPPELDPEIAAHTMVTLFEMAARLVLTDQSATTPTGSPRLCAPPSA